MGDLREDILRCRWDRRPAWKIPRLDLVMGRVRCLFRRHVPFRDSCEKPEHDYCVWCRRLTPGQAHQERVAVDPEEKTDV